MSDVCTTCKGTGRLVLFSSTVECDCVIEARKVEAFHLRLHPPPAKPVAPPLLRLGDIMKRPAST